MTRWIITLWAGLLAGGGAAVAQPPGGACSAWVRWLDLFSAPVRSHSASGWAYTWKWGLHFLCGNAAVTQCKACSRVQVYEEVTGSAPIGVLVIPTPDSGFKGCGSGTTLQLTTRITGLRPGVTYQIEWQAAEWNPADGAGCGRQAYEDWRSDLIIWPGGS